MKYGVVDLEMFEIFLGKILVVVAGCLHCNIGDILVASKAYYTVKKSFAKFPVALYFTRMEPALK